MSNILPLFPAVPVIPIPGHGDIKANAEGESPSENGGHVDTVSLDECVVKGGGELRVGLEDRRAGREKR